MKIRKIILGTVVVVVGLGLASCTSWSRFAGMPRNPIPEREPFQVWTDGEASVLHGLYLSADSLWAVPRWEAPSCDSCRIVIPLGQVDSLRTRKYSAVRTWILVGSLLGFGALLGAANPGST